MHVARSSGGISSKFLERSSRISPYVRKRLHENFEDDDSSRAKWASWDYAMDCAILGALRHSSTTIGPANRGNDRAEVCFQSVGEAAGLPVLCAYLDMAVLVGVELVASLL